VARSLRSRLVVGTLLWTGGLLCVVHLTVMVAVHHALQGRPIVLMEMGPGPGLWLTIGAALVFMAAGFVQVRRGLTALDRLRGQLAELRAGRVLRLEGTFPAEVEPLVADLNGLLDDRDVGLRRALAKAGDLAHGLKTPLAVLGQEAAAASAAGVDGLAPVVAAQVERMRRQVDYHLAQARAASAGVVPGARCEVASTAAGLARTLERLHAERRVRVAVEVPAEVAVRVRREDLEEMLGNLLDNACKWARSAVVVGAAVSAETVELTVDDDGPGLEAGMRSRVLERGVRADEATPGSGLGLAITGELAGLHGGGVALGDSPMGGLRAMLTLPLAG
jgi:signal transduction histidine kinase